MPNKLYNELVQAPAEGPREIVIDYTPRHHQMTYHNDPARFRVAVKHRRSGKTVSAVNDLIRDVMRARTFMPNAAYIAPQRNQAKRVAWPLLKHYVKGLPHDINSGDLTISLPGDRTIYVLGSDNPDMLRGLGLDAVIMDETAQINPEVWYQVVRPALAERKGRCTFIGTPKGRLNLFHNLYTAAPELSDWSACILKASTSGLIDEQELKDLRASMPANEYEQEFECSFNAAITGAYFGREMADLQANGRISTWEHDKRLPTVVSLDLGWADLTVAWAAQVEGNQVRLIKCQAWRHTTLVDVIKDIRTWGWPIARFICPHDIKVTDFSVGVSRLQIMRQNGCKVYVCRKHKVSGHDAEGIDAVRNLLPRCVFSADGCRTGIEALVQYRSEYDALADVQSRTPVHDWCSHYADAFRYLAIGLAAGAHKDWESEDVYDPDNYRRGV